MQLTHLTPDGLRTSRHQSLDLYGLPAQAAAPATAAGLDEIARLARTFTRADAAMVTLLPDGRQVTVAATASEAPLEIAERHSVCAVLLEQRPVSTIAVPDLTRDRRFADNPYVNGVLATTRGFASAPLIGRERVAIGTLCVLWQTPRAVTRNEASLLDHLARSAVNVLDDARHNRRTVQRFPVRTRSANPRTAA